MFAYYLLFNEAFIEDLLPLNAIQKHFPFLDYNGVPFFQLTDNEAREIETSHPIVHKLNINHGQSELRASTFVHKIGF
jgi:hypothetical protein